jgi:hypothetical protein
VLTEKSALMAHVFQSEDQALLPILF